MYTCSLNTSSSYEEKSFTDSIPYLQIGTWSVGGEEGEQSLHHILDGASRIATLRTGAELGDNTPAVKYNLEDHLNSSCILLDANGTLINKEEYTPFGETSFGSYGRKRYRYNGKEKDEESGLYNYGMRYYAPWMCRFVSVDPLAPKYAHLTPYQYAGNKPVNYKDIDGLESDGGDKSSPQGTNASNGTGLPTAPNSTTQQSNTSLTLPQIQYDPKTADNAQFAEHQMRLEKFNQSLPLKSSGDNIRIPSTSELLERNNADIRKGDIATESGVSQKQLEIKAEDPQQSGVEPSDIIGSGLTTAEVTLSYLANSGLKRESIPTGYQGFYLKHIKAGEGGYINANSIRIKSSANTGFSFQSNTKSISNAAKSLGRLGMGFDLVVHASNLGSAYAASDTLGTWNPETGEFLKGLSISAVSYAAPVIGLGIFMGQLAAYDESGMQKTAYSNYRHEASQGNIDRARKMLQLYHEYGGKKHLEKPQPVFRAKYY